MDRESETTIDLGSSGVASYLDEQFVLVVSTSLTVRLPAQFAAAVRTAAELRDHVRQGKLWAVRASSCRLDLGLRFDADPGFRQGRQHSLLSAFEASHVWQALGLQLRRETTIPTDSELHTYYLQHASEHSALVTPDNVPCVYVSNWHCALSFGTKSPSTDTPETLSRIVTLKLPPRKLRRFAARKRPWAQPTIGKRRQQPGPKHEVISTKSWPHDTTAPEDPEFFSFPTDLQNARLGHLIDAALSLVLGLKRRFEIFQTDSPPALSLVDIAPTIFHPLYLQGIMARMQSASLISSALGNWASTQSPILRQKIRDFPLHPIPQPQSVIEAMKNSVTSLILRSTPVPKIAMHAKKTTARIETPREETDPGGQAQDFDESFTPCYDDFENDDVNTYYRPREDDSVPLNEMQWSDNGFWVPEPRPTAWDPTGDHIGYGENGFGYYRDSDEGSDSEMLDAAPQYHRASIGSYAQQLSVEFGDRYHMGITSPSRLGPGSPQEPPDFEDTYEDDDRGARYTNTIASRYEPGGSHLITAHERAEYLLPWSNSADFCEPHSEHIYGLSNARTVFYDDDLDDDGNEETEYGYTLSSHADNILSHDDMHPRWCGPVMADDEALFGEDVFNEENDMMEQNLEISSRIHMGTLREASGNTPGLGYDLHDLDDASQEFRRLCAMNATGLGYFAELEM